jgi:hypothetical protein
MATAPTGLPRLQCDCRQGRFPQPALDISVAFLGGLAGVRLVVISRAQPRQEKGSSLNRVGRFPGLWHPVT